MAELECPLCGTQYDRGDGICELCEVTMNPVEAKGNVRLLRTTVGEFDLSVSLWLLDETGEDVTEVYDGDDEDRAREWAEEKGFTIIEEDREVVPAYHYDRIERAAKALERYLKSPYGWSDEQFEVWWNKDPDFTQRITCHGSGFIGTHKEYLFKQVKVVLDAVE